MWFSLIRMPAYRGQALVRAAADAHRVLLRQAQARQGLARVQHRAAARVGAGTLDRLDVAPGQRGGGREHLQEVQRRPLGREQRAAIGLDAADDAVGRHRRAFLVQPVDAGGRIERGEDAVEPVAAAQHGLLPHAHVRLHAAAGGHQLRGPVADADVLEQRVADIAPAGLVQRFVVVEHGCLFRRADRQAEVGQPSIWPVISSPGSTGPTPSGVPV